jgi:two-component system, cell cycle response regulator DivK
MPTTEQPAGDAARAGRNPTIVLVADDNADMRAICASRLRFHGFDPVTAEDGAEALRLAREHRPSLVLMDLRMPGIDGFTATELLKSDDETAEIPIVAVTIHDRLSDFQRAAAVRFDAFLVKPYDTEEFLEVVRYFCGLEDRIGPALRAALGRLELTSAVQPSHV